MRKPDKPSPLRAANNRRHRAALTSARDAIAALQQNGSTITFTSVAQTSGVARSWLYHQPDLREHIGRLRAADPPTTVDHHRASTESLHRMIQALRLELNRLRTENKTLKDRLARQLGTNRTQHQTAP
jgi:hypothetical protein